MVGSRKDMMADFTKGPWHVEDFDTVFWVKSSDGIKIVKTSWHDSIRKPYPLKPEARANARLIAAAPALYGTLEHIRKLLVAYGPRYIGKAISLADTTLLLAVGGEGDK